MAPRILSFFFAALLLTLSACRQGNNPAPFTELSRKKTGITFRNLIFEKETFNIFKYQYFHNGGGVAVGDFNNDGLQDLVFTGNMVKNRLYINKGNFEFEDVTQHSGIADKEGWCTGVTPVDINQDGLLDLYISRAGFEFENLRRNLLFINNGDLTFTEKAAEYGLDDPAHSTHAAFFDYDKDGDLDAFLLNHSMPEYSRGSLPVFQLRSKTDPATTNKLMRNDNGRFTDVTQTAGIYSNVLSFSLGLNIADINLDGWPDVFVGNDFNEPDYLFINQGNGMFQESLAGYFDHTSLFSMGSDIADFNNDGLPDLASLDMLPESNRLQKMHSGVDNYDKVSLFIQNGFFRQYSRNMLQRNNGDGTFSEVGQLAGVSNTDWSWSALFFDFENDGKKDLFVSNGYLRDHTNMDFLKFTADEVLKIEKGEQHVNFQEYLNQMPPIVEPNYFFQNQGDLKFVNQSAAWKVDKPTVTQGAAYADLDNDGDLDLVWSNTEDYAMILRNNAEKNKANRYLRVELAGDKGNPWAIGAKVYAYAQNQVFYQEQSPVRGFQSSMDPRLCFGLGAVEKLDSVVVIWPNDRKQTLTGVATNQVIKLNIQQAKATKIYSDPAALHTLTKEMAGLVGFRHRENYYNDFKQQALLPYFYSRRGPALAIGDVNGDKRPDVYAGGARGQAGQILLQTATGFRPAFTFHADSLSEDVDAAFFDADADGDLDLYVASGGYEFFPNDPALQDRLYINEGGDSWRKTQGALPDANLPSNCVRPADADGDGDTDLFVGGGVLPGQFPTAAPSRLLVNDGKGHFANAAPKTWDNLGIINDAAWVDLNGDGQLELIVAGDWTPISIWQLANGAWADISSQYIDFSTAGLWNSLHAADFDNDGDTDLLAGNLGLNSQLSAAPEAPLELFYDDFDNNGQIDPLICYYVQGKSYPLASMDDLVGQLPKQRKQFVYYKDYADAQIGDILSTEQLSACRKLSATTLETMYLNNQNGQLVKKSLPREVQIAPVHAIVALDANGDGHTDIAMAGNTSQVRVKLGRLDGNHGQLLLGDGKGGFTPAPYRYSGLNLRGDVRKLQLLSYNNQTCILAGINDETVRLFQIHTNAHIQ